MKQSFTLKVNTPCSEKFEQFQATRAGGFCQSCQQEVIDFTKMSDQELINYFQNVPANICGRFSAPQLKTYTVPTSVNKQWKFSWLGAGLLSLSIFSILPTSPLQAQQQEQFIPQPSAQQQTQLDSTSIKTTHIVKGTITDQYDDSPLYGVFIVIKGTAQGTMTDADGQFRIVVEEGTILVISYIGYDEKEVLITPSVLKKLPIQLSISESATILGAVHIDQPYTAKRSLWQKFKALFQKKDR